MPAHRQLTVSDVAQFKELRLESLRWYGKVFEQYHASYQRRDMDWWQEYVTPTSDKVWFGAFASDELVGIQAIRLDQPGSVFGWGNYIKPAWAGRKMMLPLYKKRLAWAQQKQCDVMRVYTLDGEDRVARILIKLGFQYEKPALISHCLFHIR